MGGQISRAIRWAAWNLFYVLRVKGFSMAMIAKICSEVACIAGAYNDQDTATEDQQNKQAQEWADTISERLLSSIDIDKLPPMPPAPDSHTGQ